MKIAVSATGTEMNSPVDPRFGRAAYLLVVDTQTMAVSRVIDNQAAQDAAHGAGINAATQAAEAGVNAVLSGRVGPKAEKVLKGAGIRIYNNGRGTVREAVQRIFGGSGIGAGADTGCRGTGGTGRDQGDRGRGCGCGGGKGRGRGKGQGRRS